MQQTKPQAGADNNTSEQTVHVTGSGGVRVITITRPKKRNAIDRPTAIALAAAFDAFDADDSASVAILTGAGGYFSAGGPILYRSLREKSRSLRDAGSRASPDGRRRNPSLPPSKVTPTRGGFELAWHAI